MRFKIEMSIYFEHTFTLCVAFLVECKLIVITLSTKTYSEKKNNLKNKNHIQSSSCVSDKLVKIEIFLRKRVEIITFFSLQW